MKTLNSIVDSTGITRFKFLKIAESLGIEASVEERDSTRVRLYSQDQIDQIVEKMYGIGKRVPHHKVGENNLITAQIQALEAEKDHLHSLVNREKEAVQSLQSEVNYLRAALDQALASTKILSENAALSDQRIGVVIAALSPQKQLAEKPRSFWSQLFGR